MNGELIAVIGMSCRFPGAVSVREYWDNLCSGRVSVSFLDEAALAAEGVDRALFRDRNYIRASYFLDNIDLFDAAFFGYAGSEAEKLDPQQRLFLECAWESLEDAGYSPLPGSNLGERSVGVFAGCRMSTYFDHVFRGLQPGGSADAFQSLVGNDKDYLCSRVSYKLNLHGPSVGVQTACSSSLSAVHLACENLRTGACDMALAGGVAVSVPQKAGYLYQRGMILSPDGYCRPFDREASGTVFSNGLGVVVLKRLEDAQADGDHIYATVLSSVVNNDGAHRVGYTAPGESGQTAVIAEALSLSGLSARDIGYVETHGTGTAIGDPIEFAALSKVFAQSTRERNFCTLGAVKANIGHADAAAGIASFIKAVMVVSTGKIPPHPLFTAANQAINLADSPFSINTSLRDWDPADPCRVAGVSSFGIGGSNAHVILCTAPERHRPQTSMRAAQTDLFVLSARSESALRELAGRMAETLSAGAWRLEDVCFTVRDSRAQDRERLTLVVATISELAEALRAFAAGKEPALLLRGQALPGGQTASAGRTGHGLSTVAAAWLGGEDDVLAPLQQTALLAGAQRVSLPTTPFQRKRYWVDAPAPQSGTLSHAVWQRRFVSVSGQIFYQGSVSAALLAQLREHRVHGLAIAPASFMFELMRSAALFEHPEGCSLVRAGIDRPLLLDAQGNQSFQLVLERGQRETLELFASADPQRSGSWSRLARAEVGVAGALSAERLDIAAGEGDPAEQIDPERYYRSVRDFGLDYGPAFQCLTDIQRQPGRALVQVDAQKSQGIDHWDWHPCVLDACLQSVAATLPASMAKAGKTFVPVACASLFFTGPAPERLVVCAELRDAAQVDAGPFEVDIRLFDGEGGQMGAIQGLRMSELPADFARHGALVNSVDTYAVTWEKKDVIPVRAPAAGGTWLILADQGGLGERVAARLREQGCICTTLPWEEREERLSQALAQLQTSSGPLHVLHCWSLDITPETNWQEANARSLLSSLRLVRQWHPLAASGGMGRLDFSLLSSRAFGPEDMGVETELQSGALNVPGQAPLWGLIPVVATEYPDLRIRVIDLADRDTAVDELLAVLAMEDDETRQALRAGHRYVPRLVPAPLPGAADSGTETGATVRMLVMDGTGLDNLGWQEEPRRAPGPGEVEVAMTASSLNFRDVMMAMGIYPGERTAIGSDGAGRVTRVGDGVGDLQVGDPVVISSYGCLRSHLTVPAAMVRKIPGTLSQEEAAGLPVAYITAWYGLVTLGQAQAGQSVLIHAASGGVGLAALSICRRRGLRIFATAGSPAKRDFVQAQGAELVLDSRTKDFGGAILQATGGRGVDLVLNSLAGEMQEASLALVADGGTFVELGKSGVRAAGRYQNPQGTFHYHPVDLVDLGREQPELMGSIFTGIMAACGRGELDALPCRSFSVNDYQAAFRFMVQTRHIGKIILTWPGTGPAETDGNAAGGLGAELLTGALGGLGLALAAARVAAGCRHLLLVVRRDPKPDEAAALRRLEAAGCTLRLVKADVSDYEQLARALQKAQEGLPPLERVWHLAGELEDDRLINLDEERFCRPFGAKLGGAWNLHRLTLDCRLKSFVLFSSIAALFGTHGQGNYAAANAGLDGLALYRRRLGLPALSVNWGAWAEVGMAARGGLLPTLQRFGVHPIPLQNGFAALDRMLRADRCRVVAALIDWPRYQAGYGLQRIPAFFERVNGAGTGSGQTPVETGAQSRRPDTLRDLDSTGVQAAVTAGLREKIAAILKVQPDELNGEANLIELGVDSLLALDLFQSMEKTFGIRLERSLLFENPTLNTLAARLAGIIGQGAGQDEEDLPLISPDVSNRFAPFQLMDMQQAYWVGRTGAMVLGKVSCHVYLELEMTGLDIKAWQRAWQRLIHHHDMLRCVMMADGRQRILPEVPELDILVDDASRLDRQQALRIVHTRREHMSHEVLPADTWPLFRVAVTQLPGNCSRLHISLDLLVADLHSMNLLMSDLAELYLHPEKELPPLHLSFRDYVLAQEAVKAGGRYQRDRQYWLERLPMLAPAPELPLALSPAQVERPHFVRHAASLDHGTWERLKRKATQVDLTVSGLLLACYAEVLACWSNRPDFTINVTLFNRLPLHPEVQRIVGDFTSISLLSCHLDPDLNFLSRAQVLQRRLWADMDHASFSGVETIREWVRATGRSSADIIPIVFTSTIGLGEKEETHPALKTFGRMVYNITQTPQVWIDHQVREIAGSLDFNWDVVDELFPPGLVDAMFRSYCRLLRILADDDRIWKRTRLPLLPDDQLARRRQVNATGHLSARQAAARTLGDFFVRSLRATPTALALVDSQVRLSYQELGRRVEALMQAMVAAGCGHGSIVAVVSDGTWVETAASLAAVSLGAVYMPIDAATPPVRLRYLLEYSGARLVLTQTSHAKLDWPGKLPIVFIDEVALEEHGDFDLERQRSHPATADDLAYIIHTSGSTGTPKGVMIRHGSACNTIHAVNRLVALAAADRVLALSRFTFDLSVWDIFGLLGAGAALVLPDPARRLEASHWVELMQRHGVTVWNTVPPLMQILLDHVEKHLQTALPPLRIALLSGDWIPLGLPRRARSLWPGLSLFGLGGATEASIWSNYFVVNEVRPEWKSIPYGQPLANQRFYVLNRQGTDCPDWVPGELHIAGDGLAAGYLNDPGRTADSFVRHPGTGEDLYATGDLARYMSDGNIEFLGRLDSQVKINGYRVELGEIENALLEHPAVGHAAAIPVRGQQAGWTLAAFAGPKPGMTPPTAGDLTSWLEERLPRFLIPGMIFVRETLPLTSSGKVDRKSLVVEPGLMTPASGAVRPGTEMERAIAAVLTKVLGHDGFGVDTRFFEMGLSSLDLVTVQSLLQEKTGLSVPLMTLLEHTNIRALASFLTGMSGSMEVGEGRGASLASSGNAPLDRGLGRAERRNRRRAQHSQQTGCKS